MSEHNEEKIPVNPKAEVQETDSDLEEISENEEIDASEEAENYGFNICPIFKTPMGHMWVNNLGKTYSEQAAAKFPDGTPDPQTRGTITHWVRNYSLEEAAEAYKQLQKKLDDSKQEALALRQVLDRKENQRTYLTHSDTRLLGKFLDDGKVELAELLLRGVTQLELLGGFKLGRNLPGCIALVEALSKRTDLQVIVLMGLRYNAASLDKFCLMLKNNRNLEDLTLDLLGVTNKIVEALRGHPKLTTFVLPLDNSDQEVDAIVELLEANPGLKTLNITRGPMLSDERVAKLAAAIAKHPGLRRVDLSCTDKGAKLCLDALRQNDRLVEFYFGGGGSKEILDAVEACLKSNREKARKKEVKEERISRKRGREDEEASSPSSSSNTVTTFEPSSSVTTTPSVYSYSEYGSMYSASSVPKPNSEGEVERQVKKGKKVKEEEQESPNPVVPRFVRGFQES